MPAAKLPPGAVRRSVTKVIAGETREVEEPVAREIPLTLFLNGEELVTLICSPGELRCLVMGFLLAEGFIRSRADVVKLTVDLREGLAWAETTAQDSLEKRYFLRRYLTSCCGKGRSVFYFYSDAKVAKQVTADIRVTSGEVLHYARELEEASRLFRATGGVHGGGIGEAGRLLHYSYDIGRHNVFDKLCGHAALTGLPLEDKVIVFTGRVSSEILLKVSKMGSPVLVARAAPTDLALTLADELGITVVGFARTDRFNVYTHKHRIVL